MTSTPKAVSVLDRIDACSRVSWHVALRPASCAFAALWFLGIFYRVVLTYEVLYTEGGASLVDQRLYSWPSLLRYGVADLFVALLVALLVFVFMLAKARAGCLFRRGAVSRDRGDEGAFRRVIVWSLRLLGYLLIAVIVEIVAGLDVGHRQVLFIMTTGLTWDVLYEGFTSGFATSYGQITSTLKWVDWVMLVIGPLSFFVFVVLPPRVARWRDRVLGSLGLLTLLLSLTYLPTRTPAVTAAVRYTPLWFTLSDIVHTWHRQEDPIMQVTASKELLAKLSPGTGKICWNPKLPKEAQLLSVAFLHPMFIRNVPTACHLPAEASHKKWNIILFVMESTGRDYVLERQARPKGKAPTYAMPFLHRLADEGLSLENHFSPANTSPRSIFAVYSGLNPMPEVRIYAMGKKIAFPSLFTFLGPSYRSFLVTPASLRWYFPRHYFARRGPQHIYDYYSLATSRRAPGVPHARHDEDSTSFFIRLVRRAIKAKRPFFGTYYSFVAHWPYPDFGPRYHRWPHTRKRWRYLNNLYLLDVQIKRVYDTVKALGALDSTIFVFLGDHGEAFGQHPHNWTHSRHSFNENYQTPMVFWQPKLFSPRKVSELTSHIDIVPTLLDALGIPHNDFLLQGESLFQENLRRRYLFLFGNEGTISSISREGIKLQLGPRSEGRRCWVYDLRRDPREKRRLSCGRYREQLRTTRFYREYQRQILRAYDKAALADEPFFGQSHPQAREGVRRSN